MSSVSGALDFIVYDQRRQPALLVEVKGGRNTSEEWAARYRRNLLAHGNLPKAPYFLIATPQQMYFWRQNGSGASEEPPQFTLDATKELRPYVDKADLAPEEMYGEVLELVLFSWLVDLLAS